jgi:hypothetical protein
VIIIRVLVMLLISLASFQATAQRHPVPVINYENVPFTNATSSPLDNARIKEAIKSAAAVKQWSVVEQGDGRMLATLNVRGKHTVVIEIVYLPERFSVFYKDSTNMKYSPGPDGKGMIHPFYNRWVQELKEAIRLSLLKV